MTLVALSVHTSGRNRPVASAKPATVPVASDGRRLADREGRTARPEAEGQVAGAQTRVRGPPPCCRRCPAPPGAEVASHSPATSVGPSTCGSLGSQSTASSTSASRSGRYCPSAGDHQPVPDASPRSVVKPPVSRYVSQSWGSSTRASRRNVSGSWRRSQRSFVIVKLATGTLPQASAQALGPSSSTSAAASSADSVSFQSLAGRSTSPPASSTTSPCC